MWIVRVALDKAYTIFVMVICIVLFGVMAVIEIPRDIFPNINIPIVAVVFTYSGMLPADMSGRIVYYFERTLTTQVNNVKTIESQSLDGYGIIKIYFQSGVDISTALAQTTAVAQTVLKLLPPGITPPFVLSYSADTVPVIQLALSGHVPQVKLFDLAQNFIRPQLASVAGASIPSPYGGLNRSIMADLNLTAMQANNVSASEVVTALEHQNLVIPAGTEKIGPYEDYVALNASPTEIDKINDLPVKRVNGTVIYMRDVAFVHNGAPPQTNLVRDNGDRAVLLPVYKIGTASTLSITSGVKSRIPRLKEGMPKGLNISVVGDQSGFVKAAIDGVVSEGTIAASLTALLMLLFLGSWRPTVIVAVSIPLAILVSICVLWGMGDSLNTMTAGGLALAVGILVDDTTVMIENISVHLEEGKNLRDAILAAGKEIALPALVSTLSICIVFVPMFILSGVSYYLFTPLALAVILALLASYVLSRTLVPTAAMYLLTEKEEKDGDAGPPRRRSLYRRLVTPLTRFQQWFERGFKRLGEAHSRLLEGALGRPWIFVGAFLAFSLASIAVLEPWLGRDFFPHVYGDSIALHIRAHSGTRIEDTARLCDEIEQKIRQIIQPKNIKTITDNIDLPYSGLNMAYSNTGTIGPQDADIIVTMGPSHGSTLGYIRTLRHVLPRDFPGTTFAFLPADITSQILNFGTPSSIDLQISGSDEAADHAYAVKLLHRLKHVAGVVDARLQQRFDYPEINVAVDRTLAQQVGLTQSNVADSLLSVLSGSFQVKPNFWLDVKSGVSYPLIAQTPQYRVDSLSDLTNIPITGQGGADKQILGALATFERGPADAIVSHYNVQPVVDIYATYSGRDLGSINDDIQDILKQTAKQKPQGSSVAVRGQVETMETAYSLLFPGIGAAILLVYLLIVINFQSWLDPFVIVTALPAALAGIVWALFITFTPISVPALTGTIMCMGIATANSVLVISFAREELAAGRDAVTAALKAGQGRLRPVIMTATAMIIGMGPMSLGLGAGGAQNAPLGRAVIGGLLFATVSTLFFVPVVFSLVHRRDQHEKTDQDPDGHPA
ncbi:efflux RND transporter permease subunit [Acidisphaera rubrifaciens]|uniref:RND superfamily multidrug efflux pump acriflavin resistance protein n=1 Tax=Acidisphaera rubrifaciens HS-AP3 TaxID=1231350 RepID=A0A0D6P2J4_9PROT|nr:efflux RND transporter permease subunit [Acidisphaera rubrifaciens]GAN75985.1 RND superfamily multidrug efflux pump acriflavin resistance protein [Acidisphaera rubrifaciens HS-AP3]